MRASRALAALPRARPSAGWRFSSSSVRSYDRFLSRTSQLREASPIRALQPLVSLPGMISLGGGMPNPGTFPFDEIVVRVKGSSEPLVLSGESLATALQYSPTPGLPRLVTWLHELQAREHRLPDAKGTRVCVTTGSQDGLTKAFAALLDPEDTLLVEDPTYPGSLAFLRPLGCALRGVPTDGDGMNTAELQRVLEQWDAAHDGKKPKARAAAAGMLLHARWPR